jgi:DNA-binding response OmpR family regulator
MKILFIEDNLRLSELIKKNLETDKFIVDVANTLEDAQNNLASYNYDLIILDLNLPDGSGEDFLIKIRKKKYKIPVIILTANSNFDVKIKNLNLGADDFLTKPFKHEELVARIHAILRRPIEFSSNIFEKGNVKFNNNSGEMLINNKDIKLSKKEILLFEILSNKFSKTVTKSEIENKMYDNNKEISSNPIEVTLFRLRKNLEKNKSNLVINNLKGIGYRLVNAKK